jgi:hypothetical protein
MIGKIDKAKHFKGIIEYHEKKVAKNEATLLYNDTLEKSTSGKIRDFLTTSELNPAVRLNKCAHFNFDFKVGETLDDQLAIKAMKEVLFDLGYINNQFLIYRHYDKAHQHYHVVTSTVKLDGIKVNDFEDHIKIAKLCRIAEKKYGFQVPENKNEYRASLSNNALQMNQYSIGKAMKKVTRDPLLSKIVNLIGESSFNEIKNQTLNNQQIFDRVGEKSYEKILNELNRKKLIKSPRLLKLRNLLLDTLKVSKTNYEFLENCKKLDIYYRPLIKQGQKYFVFGHDGFYAKDYKIHENITYEKLFKTNDFQKINDGRNFDTKEQISFLKRNITRAANTSKSIEEFNTQLAIRNIDPIYASNNRGIYGVSFKSNQIKNAEIIKGSTIGLSYTKLLNLLHENQKNSQLPNFEESKQNFINYKSVIESSNNSIIKNIKPSKQLGSIKTLSHLLSGDDTQIRELSLRLKREDKDEDRDIEQ